MSWKDIIKQPKREDWRERIKRKRGEKKYKPTPVKFIGGSKYKPDEVPDWEEPQEIELDEDELKETCCEQAKNSLLGWVSSHNQYDNDEETREGLIQVIEFESCDTIKETFFALSGVNKNKELRQILKDWEECESGS